jgi:peroxiredoxin
MYIDSQLAATRILDLQGNPVRFSMLYANGPTMIVFVRHFGCIFCRERVRALTACIDGLDGLGYDAVIIGNGTPLMAQAFAEELALEVPLYTDPERVSFRLAGMQRIFGLTLRSLRAYLRSLRSGARQGTVAGDVWQQGGIITVGADGLLIDRQVDSGAGDYIDLMALAGRLASRVA